MHIQRSLAHRPRETADERGAVPARIQTQQRDKAEAMINRVAGRCRRMLQLVFMAVVTLGVVDNVFWKHIFEANQLWQYDDIYHRGYWLVVGALLLFGAAQLWSDDKKYWLDALSFVVLTWVFVAGGAVDVMYYWLDGQAVPATLPWLDKPGHGVFLFHPVTAGNIWISPLLYFVVITPVFWVCAYLQEEKMC